MVGSQTPRPWYGDEQVRYQLVLQRHLTHARCRCDHPHGGGRGKSKGNKQPRSIWGWLTKGKRTRKPGPKGPKGSNKLVVHERPRGKEKRMGR